MKMTTRGLFPHVGRVLLAGLIAFGGSVSMLHGQHENHGTMPMDRAESGDHMHHHGQAMQAAEPLSEQSVYQFGRTWTNHRNESVRLEEFLESPVIVVMFYGSCTEVCPILIRDSWRLYQEVDPAKREQIRVLAVTFDTEHDTPDRLADYARSRQLDLPGWHFLTGSDRAVRELAMALGVEYRRRSDGMYDHTNLVAVLDMNGEIAHRVEGLGREMNGAAETIEKMIRGTDE